MAQTILLVNSDPQGREILRQYLTHHGYEVLDAEDGETGLRLVRERQPDLIIGDFPLDVAGHSPFAAAAIKEGGYAGRFISITTRARPAEIEAARAVSDAVLLKPILPSRVLQEVRRLLGP